MDYKEKYEAALDRAKSLAQTKEERVADLEYIFPELHESEDERIRKSLLRMISDIDGGYPFENYGIIKKDVIAYLEKQKERGPLTKEEEYTLQRIIERLEDEGCPQSWKDLLYDIYNLPYEKQKEPEDKGEISDGYHTFNQLYYYRMLYNAAFFNLLPKEWVHKSKRHHDGEECFGGGWFIVMANLPTGQISNHYELKDWDLFQIPEKETADEWDGHTPQEAAERIHKYLQEKQKEQTLAEWTGYSGIVINKAEYSELTAAEWAILRGFTRVTGRSHFPITIIKETAQDFLAHLVMISEICNENK